MVLGLSLERVGVTIYDYADDMIILNASIAQLEKFSVGQMTQGLAAAVNARRPWPTRIPHTDVSRGRRVGGEDKHGDHHDNNEDDHGDDNGNN